MNTRPAWPLVLAAGLCCTVAMRPALADDKSDALLKQSAAATHALNSLTADVGIKQVEGTKVVSSTGTVKLLRPNRALIATTGRISQTISSDGANLTNLMGTAQYTRTKVAPDGANISLLWAVPVNAFFGAIDGPFGKVQSTRYTGPETVNGKSLETVTAVLEQKRTLKLYIDPATHLIVRSDFTVPVTNGTVVLGAALSNIKLNPPLKTADLAYTLPRTAKLYEAPNYDAKLIPVGKLATAFDLVSLKGDHITLAEAGHEKKAVLVNFWFYG